MKPVLIGIDPGNNGADPLHPTSPTGKRLVRAVGEAILLRDFDRVNLHSSYVPGRTLGEDRRAAMNLLPILRGRRVVTFGERAARAVSGPVSMDRRWYVHRDGFVVAHFDHPSPKNKRNNSAEFRETFGEDLRRTLLPCLHVEGPDGAGKSTLVRELLERLPGSVAAPTQGPPTSWEECLARIGDRVLPGLVCDRSSGLLSELVYGPILRGETVVNEESIWDEVRAVLHVVTFVYCRPPREALLPRSRIGEEKSHLDAVEANLDRLRDRYEVVMTEVVRLGGRVISFDRTRVSTEDLLKCVDWR